MELIASVGQIGACLGYPAGLVSEILGPAGSFLLALLLTGASSLLLYTTQYSTEFYHDHWWLLMIYWTIYGRSPPKSIVHTFTMTAGSHLNIKIVSFQYG